MSNNKKTKAAFCSQTCSQLRCEGQIAVSYELSINMLKSFKSQPSFSMIFEAIMHSTQNLEIVDNVLTIRPLRPAVIDL
jgi:hypothetical protein